MSLFLLSLTLVLLGDVCLEGVGRGGEAFIASASWLYSVYRCSRHVGVPAHQQ